MKFRHALAGLLVLVLGAGVAVAQEKTIVFIPKSTSATFYLFLVKGAQDKAK
jgi:ABC-type sugar transport system substrate-binding protein